MNYSLSTHVDVGHLNFLSKNKCSIAEKADGIYVNKISKDIFPYDILVEAEYIKSMDFYLIFNIENEETINMNQIERMNYLRDIHNKADKLNNNKTLDSEDYIKEILKEREEIKKYINEGGKWWPKGNWLLPEGEEFLNILIKLRDIEENKVYGTDGWIITPLNNKYIGKLKPKDELTVDLIHNRRKWRSREGKLIKVINTKNLELKKGIYRCYWNEEKENWDAREYREDKKRANPYYIIEKLYYNHKNNWRLEDIKDIIKKETYYQNINIKLEEEIIKYLDEQRNISMRWLIDVTNINKCLDIGCGKGGFNKIREKLNINEWTGIDIDVASIFKMEIKKSEGHWIWMDFNKGWNIEDQTKELGEIWGKTESYKMKYLNEKYDLIISNFSIQNSKISEGSLKNLIEEITKRSTDGTIFKVCFPDKEKLLLEFEKNNLIKLPGESYVKYINNDSMEIYFPWTHKKSIIEPLLSSKELEEILIKYGWVLEEKKYIESYLIWKKWQKNLVYMTFSYQVQ
jgi:hypothetical protein